MNSPFVLLVDDEVPFVETMTKRLAKRDLNVIAAFSGQEALDILDKQPNVDVVILDVKMPGMDGIELLKFIKTGTPDIEVIMITAHGDLRLAIESLKMDAVDFITKPINVDALEIALRRALEKQGRKFVTRSDTEVVLQHIDARGTNGLRDLNGMFAFVIWNKKEKKVFAARDRVGKKPFYYTWDGRTFAFASEIKALLAGNFSKKQINNLDMKLFFDTLF